ncbi:hypothetical protein IFM89_003293 [Coptis chinensis]|uniref:Ribosomal RNA-processing protein 40 n=1 Tax=Coptis chinensis TaxID=261450 RepID=A0A835HRL0_9MAGN|nr:hypothetical protein IFM89_003293 [Coptis chinensis]
MVADSKSAFIDQTVVPGDVVLDLSSMSNHTIKLGQGLRQDGDVISVMKAGKLRFSKPNKYWVESSNKRVSIIIIIIIIIIVGKWISSLFYSMYPVEDTVLGIVFDQKADNFLVDIKGPTLAFLPILAFEGGSRRNMPKFEEARRQKEGKKARIKKLDDWRDIHPQWCDRKPKKKERERKYKSQTLKVMGDVEVQCGEEKKLVEKCRNTGTGSCKELGRRLVLQSEVEEGTTLTRKEEIREGNRSMNLQTTLKELQCCLNLLGLECHRTVQGNGYDLWWYMQKIWCSLQGSLMRIFPFSELNIIYFASQVGKLMYVQVVKANADMNPELSCTDVNGKAAEFGPLKHATCLNHQLVCHEFVSSFKQSFGDKKFICQFVIYRLLSSPTCPVLEALGKKLSFEIAVGVNGRVWVNAKSPSTVILVSNAIMTSESLTGVQQRIMVEKLMQRVQ